VTDALPSVNYQNFHAYVHDLYVAAGRPSTRYIARHTLVSHTTVSDIVHGRRRSTWSTVSAIVKYLRGDPRLAKTLWDGLFDDEEVLTAAGRVTLGTTLVEIRDLLTEIRDLLANPGDRKV
jgi:hypothetical protein